MQQAKYFDYIYKIVGENLQKNPDKLFDSKNVYLFIDKHLNIIWVWAGLKSRLFHRYIAANWAGKLKNKKEFYGFKYEVVKEGKEPLEFQYISGEIKRGPEKYSFPGESRKKNNKSTKFQANTLNDLNSQVVQTKLNKTIGESRFYSNNNIVLKINTILSEIKEIHSHVKYSIQHIDKKINQIEQLLRTIK